MPAKKSAHLVTYGIVTRIKHTEYRPHQTTQFPSWLPVQCVSLQARYSMWRPRHNTISKDLQGPHKFSIDCHLQLYAIFCSGQPSTAKWCSYMNLISTETPSILSYTLLHNSATPVCWGQNISADPSSIRPYECRITSLILKAVSHYFLSTHFDYIINTSYSSRIRCLSHRIGNR